MIRYAPYLKPYARRLRRNMTDSERLLWSRLRRDQVLGVRFYRQRSIDCFIVDFYSPAARLVIEIDGSQHLELLHHCEDRQRDEALRRRGLEVLRFPGNVVLTAVDAVMEVVFRVVEERVEG